LGSIDKILSVGKIAKLREVFNNPATIPTGGDVDGGEPPLEDFEVIDK